MGNSALRRGKTLPCASLLAQDRLGRAELAAKKALGTTHKTPSKRFTSQRQPSAHQAAARKIPQARERTGTGTQNLKKKVLGAGPFSFNSTRMWIFARNKSTNSECHQKRRHLACCLEDLGLERRAINRVGSSGPEPRCPLLNPAPQPQNRPL